MKIAYISHHNRPCYEYPWFSSMNAESVEFIDTDFSHYPKTMPKNIFYRKADFKENWFLNKFFHSTASIVKYFSHDKFLEKVNTIITLEVFSSLSRQFVELGKKTGKKTAVLVYELIPNHPIYSIPYYQKNTKFVIKNANKFICVSNKAAQHLLALGAKKNKIKVIYPGIDLNIFKPGVKESKHSKIRLIFTGKLEKHKGVDDLIEIFQTLTKKYKDKIELMICGKGSYLKEIKHLIKSNKNVKYFGQVKNERLPEILSEADIYVFPAEDTYKLNRKIGSEQFGFSVVEALACGLPVVSYDCGALKEIIGKNNFSVAMGNKKALLEKIIKLIENPKLRKSVGKENLKRVGELFDINKQADTLKTFLENA